jgi:hypothetical protein
MDTIVDQRKDSKKHMPPKPGLHPHPVPPPAPRPEERGAPKPPRSRPTPPSKGALRNREGTRNGTDTDTG